LRTTFGIARGKRNEKRVIIRSGDIHSGLKLRGNHANVCQTLRGEILQNLAGIKLLSECGPRMSGNTYFRRDYLFIYL
jgi:hypothetical protein